MALTYFMFHVLCRKYFIFYVAGFMFFCNFAAYFLLNKCGIKNENRKIKQPLCIVRIQQS